MLRLKFSSLDAYVDDGASSLSLPRLLEFFPEAPIQRAQWIKKDTQREIWRAWQDETLRSNWMEDLGVDLGDFDEFLTWLGGEVSNGMHLSCWMERLERTGNEKGTSAGSTKSKKSNKPKKSKSKHQRHT
jgi:hypothetical protein